MIRPMRHSASATLGKRHGSDKVVVVFDSGDGRMKAGGCRFCSVADDDLMNLVSINGSATTRVTNENGVVIIVLNESLSLALFLE